MATFDIVSKANLAEVTNAVNQAQKEFQGRFDFRGSQATIEWDQKEVIIFKAEDDYRVKSILDILLGKLHKRGIDIKSLKIEDPVVSGHKMVQQKISVRQGIDKELGKSIVKETKSFKVQAQIQDDQIRVTSKSIDELQSLIAHLKKQSFELPLQFENFRS